MSSGEYTGRGCRACVAVHGLPAMASVALRWRCSELHSESLLPAVLWQPQALLSPVPVLSAASGPPPHVAVRAALNTN